MAKIIDGKKISAEIKEELKTEVAGFGAILCTRFTVT